MASQYETAGQSNTAGRNENTGQSDTAGRNESSGQAQVDKVLSTVADAMRVPMEMARQVLPAQGGMPVYAGLGALAVIGLIDWPIAAAAGAGYALARMSSRLEAALPEPRPAAPAPDPITGHAPGTDPVTRPAPGAPGTGAHGTGEPSSPAQATDPITHPAPGAPGTGEPTLPGAGPLGTGEPGLPGTGPSGTGDPGLPGTGAPGTDPARDPLSPPTPGAPTE